MANKSGFKLESDKHGSRVYLVDTEGNESLISEVKVNKDEQLLSGIKLDVDKLNIVHPDGRDKILNANFIKSSDLKISDVFVRQLTSRTSFIESLEAVNFDFGNSAIANLMNEVSELRQEVAELKQKLEVE